MFAEILIFQFHIIKLIKILKFDKNIRFYKYLLEFDKSSNQKYKIE